MFFFGKYNNGWDKLFAKFQAAIFKTVDFKRGGRIGPPNNGPSDYAPNNRVNEISNFDMCKADYGPFGFILPTKFHIYIFIGTASRGQ